MRITRSNRSVSNMAKDSLAKSLFEKFLNINIMLLKAGGIFDDRGRLKNPLGLISLGLLCVWTIAEMRQVILHFNLNRELALRCIISIFSGSLATTKVSPEPRIWNDRESQMNVYLFCRDWVWFFKVKISSKFCDLCHQCGMTNTRCWIIGTLCWLWLRELTEWLSSIVYHACSYLLSSTSLLTCMYLAHCM